MEKEKRSSKFCDKILPAPNGRESGQIMIAMLLMLAVFLLAVVGFAVDLTSLWFHRQAAQTAADAACQAGATDMEALAAGLAMPNMGFTPGTSGDCASGTGSICFYANANGYNGSGMLANSPSNSVTWSFPASVAGVTTPPSAITSYPFLNVVVTENVKTHFLFTIHGTSYQKVAASCTCGTTQIAEAAPMIVLSPSAASAFYYSGGAAFNILGGPPRGLQVNSTNAKAIDCEPSAWIDTSKGGPEGTGSSVGVVGGPSTAPSQATCPGGGFNGGTTGGWTAAALPVPDPYAGVAAPTKPPLSTTASEPHVVVYGQDGCPDHSPTNYVRDQTPHSGCLEFEPGYYSSAINLNANDMAIFKPGIYYMDGNLNVGGSDNVRIATPCVP
ncbi:MAG: pilus assembly protein TadG-related protein, partial [Acidobacteriaceae bacterium]